MRRSPLGVYISNGGHDAQITGLLEDTISLLAPREAPGSVDPEKGPSSVGVPQ